MSYKKSHTIPAHARTAVLMAVCVVAFGTAAAVAAVVALPSGPENAVPTAAESERKDWQLVGQTDDPRFGTVEFYRSQPEGQPCFGYRIVDQDRPFGTQTIYHSCDGATTLDAGWIRKAKGSATLARGWVSDDIERVTLNVPGEGARELPLVAGRGVAGRFFASSHPSALRGATVEAWDGSGKRRAARTSAP